LPKGEVKRKKKELGLDYSIFRVEKKKPFRPEPRS